MLPIYYRIIIPFIRTKINSIYKVRKYLSLQKFEISSPEGINNERYRKAMLNTATSVIAKGISIITGFVSVPLTINYLGVERYGLWMTIISFTMALKFADLGLGNGLINTLSKTFGTNDREEAKKAVSSVFFILLAVASFLLIIFSLFYTSLPWGSIFNVRTEIAINESGPSAAVFFICFILNIPIGIVQRIQRGYQEGYIFNLWETVGNILSLVALLFAIYFKLGLPLLILAIAGIPIIVRSINMFFQFFYVRKWIKPRLGLFDIQIAKRLLNTGIVFTIITLANILGSSVDNIIIAQYMGASFVTEYSIVQKLYSILFIVTFITAPFWPAFGEAFALADYSWAQRAFYKIQLLSFWVTIMICLPLVLFGQFLIKIWVGTEVIPSLTLIVGFAFFWIASGLAQAAINIMQTEYFIRRLLVITVTYGILSFLLKIAVIPAWGLPGVIYAGGLSYGIFFTLPIYLIVTRDLKLKNN